MKRLRVFSVLLGLVVSSITAQELRVTQFNSDGTLEWAVPTTNAFCCVEATTCLTGSWDSLEFPLDKLLPISLTNVAVVSITNRSHFYRLCMWTNDVVPRFVETDYIELSKISQISRFRSSEGHDYSDDFESCRSMKHYFKPSSTIDWSTVKIFSPVAGVVDRKWDEWAGTQLWIKSSTHPDFTFIIFHITLTGAFNVGDPVSEGQQLGTHVGDMTWSDIAVGVSTDQGWKLVSYFDVMKDPLFETYYHRGVLRRSGVIISREERDADPLTCAGEVFTSYGSLPNWVTLD